MWYKVLNQGKILDEEKRVCKYSTPIGKNSKAVGRITWYFSKSHSKLRTGLEEYSCAYRTTNSISFGRQESFQ
jgi:hypothetical protein